MQSEAAMTDEDVNAGGTSSDQAPFGVWLNKEMDAKGISIQELANKTGISYPGIWNIVRGKTRNPIDDTRRKIAAALEQPVPTEIEQEISQESNVSGYDWIDFSPSDLQTVPEKGGVYVFYDITDRPVYVGKSKSNVRLRVKDHQTRFWFKPPLVERGSFLAIADPDMCSKIEMILIKFMGSHALLNTKGVVRDLEE
jgi:transcriptional regulator with XRE-family HTH domain